MQDDTLLLDPDLTAGLKPGGSMLVNSDRPSEEVAQTFGCRALTVPATEIAVEEIGRPIPNTALLAAFFTLTGILPLDALATALRGRFHGDMLDRNLKLIDRAAATVPADAWKETADA